jgi:hypothetical protein
VHPPHPHGLVRCYIPLAIEEFKRWTKVGAAFPHKEGTGFNIELKAFPIDGRLVALPPDTEDNNSRNGK